MMVIGAEISLQQVAGLEAIPVRKCCPEGEAVSQTGECQTQAGSESRAEIEILAFSNSQQRELLTRTLQLGAETSRLPSCTHTELHTIKLGKGSLQSSGEKCF